jgi:tRNA (cytidine56-2'-O)-methyltransferase
MIEVLRLGHRFARDARISTHLGLTARAFGADRIVYDARASDVKESVEAIVKSWGGDFRVEYTDNPVKYMRGFDGSVFHLTMYGLPLGDVLSGLDFSGDALVVVGGAKVPSEVYDIADYNVAVGGQPHSEVAALAVFLDRFSGGEGIRRDFRGGKTVVPCARGKKVVER